MDSLFPASLPLIVFMASLIAKRGAIVASMAGILSVLLIGYFYNADYSIDLNTIIMRDLPVVFILTLSAALVIFPGQIMNALLKQTETINEIGKFIQTIEMPRLRLASIMVLGIAPALESLTGFGVSLFFTVPALMRLFSLRKALVLSLLGMNIMPWGTLALATVIGSQITGLSFTELSYRTSLTSFLVFPMIGCFIYFICRKDDSSQLYQFLYPVTIGFVFSSFLVLWNIYFPSELVGVYAGIGAVMIGFMIELYLSKGRLFSNTIYSKIQILRMFSPYIVLISLIGISRIEIVYRYLHDFFVFRNRDINFSILTSPGIFIFITIICLYSFSGKYIRDNRFFFDGVKRSVYPVAGISLFVAFAQIQQSSGILKALASGVSGLSLTENILISPLVGMIGGYTTGSNVGGNVLFMSLQSEIGSYFDKKLLFSAVQNSSAGHAVFMSVPIILLTLAIAKIDDADSSNHGNWLIRRTFLYAPFIYFAITLAFYTMAIS